MQPSAAEERRRRRAAIAGFLTSCIVHFVLVISLALCVVAAGGAGGGFIRLLSSQEDGIEPLSAERIAPDHTPEPSPWVQFDPANAEVTIAIPEIVPTPAAAKDAHQPAATEGRETVGREDVAARIHAVTGGGLAGRSRGPVRDRLANGRGMTRESEQAVARGLRWLAAHQLDDGGWDFDHTKSRCRGLCANPGTESSRTAATAIALLAFFGDGHTHRQGDYQEEVRRGIYFLSTRAVLTPNGADLQEGTMYGQGLSTMALCEAYAMSEDPALVEIARRAVRFVLFAQDKAGGGWRYSPGEPGDTTVTTWQLMALKSAQLARLQDATPTLVLADRFLDSVQSDGGARYGYQTPQPRDSTTAMGLLCRMYLGWKKDRPALYRGVAYLSRVGPSERDIYYNYYATQVLCHWGGPLWKAWDAKLRPWLIAQQSQTSHEAGSWYFGDDHGSGKGGRLYCTTMAVMTLEVYYRYLPIYGDEATERGL